MNTGIKLNRLRREFQHYLLEGFSRITDANLRGNDILLEIGRNERRRSTGLTKSGKITRISVKRDFARRRLGHRSGPGNFLLGIADQFAAASFRDFLKRQSHKT